MFVTNGQFYVFLACFGFGGVCGILFSISASFKKLFKNKKFTIIFDVLAFLISSILFVFYSFKLNFPSLRAYMIVGVFVGIFIYLKSFHIILAKTLKKAYNIIKKITLRKNKSRYDRRKN